MKVLKRISLLLALEITLAIALAFFAGSTIAERFNLGNPLIAGLWCSISTVLVLAVDVQKVHRAAWFRLIGSLTGSFVAGSLTTLFGYQVWVLWISIFISVVLVSLANVHLAYRLTCVTVIVIIVVGMHSPELIPWKNALSRFFESVLGTTIAIAFSWIFYPIRHHLSP